MSIKCSLFLAIISLLFPHTCLSFDLHGTGSGSVYERPIASAEKPSLGEAPIGTLAQRTSADVFGRKGGFIHPFLSVTEYYTDNVFYSNKNKESDFITVLSPGIWLTVPHVHEKLLEIETSNISPGGYSLKRYEPETFRRYQTYLFYNADIEQFAKHPSENAVNHKAEGLFQYNLKGGLSATVLDQFIASHDDRGTGTSDKLDRFKTNLANLVLTYDVSRRFRIRADYSNFLVNYTAKRNNFRDRDDNSVSGYVFYKIQPKTSLFVEYEYLDVSYKKDIQPDSREHHYYGGIQWDITAKSRGTVKAGYGVKDFTGSETGNSEDFILEAQIDHKFTPKTSVILRASRQTNETNISGYDFILTDIVELEYLQRLTGKITADIKLLYEKDDYEGDPTIVGRRLVDKYYSGAFALRYQFREWLGFDLGYIYMERDSNDNDFDYDTNVVFLRITGTL